MIICGSVDSLTPNLKINCVAQSENNHQFSLEKPRGPPKNKKIKGKFPSPQIK